MSDDTFCTPPSPQVFSVHGLARLSPKLARASNAASNLASNTGMVWFALSGALHPATDTKGTRELFVGALELLREHQEQWHTDISECREELVLARSRIGGVARAGEFVEVSGHKLAVSYYERLEMDLWQAENYVWSSTSGCCRHDSSGSIAYPWFAPSQKLGEDLHTIAKVLAGLQPHDVIPNARAAKNRRAAEKRSVCTECFEQAQATLQAHCHLGQEINVLIEQEVIEARAASAHQTARTSLMGSAEAELIAPDKFRFRDCPIVSGLTALEWRLLEVMLKDGKLRPAVPLAEAIGHVYGIHPTNERAIGEKERTFNERRRSAAKKLEEHNVRLEFNLKNDFLSLQPF
jgi:hypothetical protein